MLPVCNSLVTELMEELISIFGFTNFHLADFIHLKNAQKHKSTI